MRGIVSGVGLAGAAWLAIASPASSQAVTVHGPGGVTRVLSAADIAAMPHESALLPAEGGGTPRRYEGVPLQLILQNVGAPSGRALRGPALADVVVVRGADGYRAAFALAEMDPGMRGEKILLADRVEGGPLAANEGPLRLVVEGDGRPARSVRAVAELTVESAP
jgi:DMSO/TMAO reductase YedYZ molybdopterin-dependent catalytic subunit